MKNNLRKIAYILLLCLPLVLVCCNNGSTGSSNDTVSKEQIKNLEYEDGSVKVPLGYYEDGNYVQLLTINMPSVLRITSTMYHEVDGTEVRDAGKAGNHTGKMVEEVRDDYEEKNIIPYEYQGIFYALYDGGVASYRLSKGNSSNLTISQILDYTVKEGDKFYYHKEYEASYDGSEVTFADGTINGISYISASFNLSNPEKDNNFFDTYYEFQINDEWVLSFKLGVSIQKDASQLTDLLKTFVNEDYQFQLDLFSEFLAEQIQLTE